jgi:hypothetical protein
MIFAVDPASARRALEGGLLGCPRDGCGGRLRPWGTGRSRRVTAADGRVVEVTPDRARCRVCRVSHVVLPAWCVPRRAYGVEVVGSALLGKAAEGKGHRRIARERGLPEGTVRGWLRAAGRGAGALLVQAARFATSAVSVDLWPPGRGMRLAPAGELTAAIDALAVAASAFARPAPPSSPPPGETGVDYFGLLAARHRRAVLDRLHVVDPDGHLPGLPLWQVVNVITRGGLVAPALG